MRWLRVALRSVEGVVVTGLLVLAVHHNDPMLVVAAAAESLAFECLIYWLISIDEQRRRSR